VDGRHSQQPKTTPQFVLGGKFMKETEKAGVSTRKMSFKRHAGGREVPMKESKSGFDNSVRSSIQQKMIRHNLAMGIIGLVMLWINPAIAQQSVPIGAAYGASGQPPLMERDKEMALALSACPRSVADKAGVYILEKSGYVRVRESQNGFTAIVGHTLPNAVEPQCMNAEATRTHLPITLKLAELRAQGKSSEEIRQIMAEARAKGVFPKQGGINYMLSKENLTPNFKGVAAPFPPHVMFYVPGMTNGDAGADITVGPDGNPTAPAFIVNEGTPQATMIVPVEVHPESAQAAKHNHSGDSQ
jgi:hypothetical protein